MFSLRQGWPTSCFWSLTDILNFPSADHCCAACFSHWRVKDIDNSVKQCINSIRREPSLKVYMLAQSAIEVDNPKEETWTKKEYMFSSCSWSVGVRICARETHREKQNKKTEAVTCRWLTTTDTNHCFNSEGVKIYRWHLKIWLRNDEITSLWCFYSLL